MKRYGRNKVLLIRVSEPELNAIFENDGLSQKIDEIFISQPIQEYFIEEMKELEVELLMREEISLETIRETILEESKYWLKLKLVEEGIENLTKLALPFEKENLARLINEKKVKSAIKNTILVYRMNFMDS